MPNAFSKVITDLADLMQKEMRLVQAELSEKLSISIRAGVWMSVAAVLAIVGVFLIVQAIVLGLSAATGIALHWSCLIVAAVLAGADWRRVCQKEGRCAPPAHSGPGHQSGQARHSCSQGAVHMSTQSRPLLGDGGAWIFNAIKRNRRLLLLAAGAVLMMRTNSPQSTQAASIDATYGPTKDAASKTAVTRRDRRTPDDGRGVVLCLNGFRYRPADNGCCQVLRVFGSRVCRPGEARGRGAV